MITRHTIKLALLQDAKMLNIPEAEVLTKGSFTASVSWLCLALAGSLAYSGCKEDEEQVKRGLL